jgi:hypothetical protein
LHSYGQKTTWRKRNQISYLPREADRVNRHRQVQGQVQVNRQERKVQKRNRQRKFSPSQSQVQNTKRKEGGNQVRPTGITKSKD